MNKNIITDLAAGNALRVKVSKFCKSADISLPTAYRKIKLGELEAIRDPQTGHIFIPAQAALDYLNRCSKYQHEHQNLDAISKMETARNGKCKRT
jgi:hypothetical protein